MLSRILPFVAAAVFAQAAPVPTPTQRVPANWKAPPPPALDQIIWGSGSASVFDVTDQVKQDLEARPGHEQLRIVLRHRAGDAELAKLVTKLPWVEHLNLDEPTSVTSLAPIAKLSRLKMLHLNTNAVKTLAPLANLRALEALTVTCSNDFTDTDLMAIAGATTLKTIDLRRCSTLTNLHGLEKLVDLESVSTYSTPISDIGALAGHPKIRALNLHDNTVADLAPIAGMTELSQVNLRGATAAAKSFDAFRGLAKLYAVDLSKTNITSLDVLGASPSLWSLTVQDAKSVTLAKLPAWSSITMLHLDGTNIADLTPVASLLPSLGYITFDRTPVTTLKALVKMPNLRHVTMPAAMSDAEVLAFEQARPGIALSRYGKPLPGRPAPVPIP